MSRRKIPLDETKLNNLHRMIKTVNHHSNRDFLQRIWLKGYFTKGERKRLNILVTEFNKVKNGR